VSRGATPARLTVAFAVAATVSVSLPVFLLGALIVEVRRDLHVPVWALGVMVALFWSAAALAASRAGDLDARLGSRRLTVLSLATAGVSLVGLAAASPSWGWLVAWAVVAGAANGVQHPATNALITAQVALGRRGLAFGLKQAAVPAATVLAGLAIPGIALAYGWRWAFAGGALVCFASLACYLLVGPGGAVHARVRGTGPRMPAAMNRYFLVLAVVAFAGGTTTIACSAYLVVGAIDRGIGAATAGIVLSAASVIGIVTRVVMGFVADRHRDRSLGFASALVTVGGVGGVLMAVPTLPTFLVGAAFSIGLAGAWSGLVHYFISRTAGPMTSRATGMVQTGSFIGCAAGPLVFGAIYGLDPALLPWLFAGVVGLLGGALGFALARRPLDPHTESTA